MLSNESLKKVADAKARVVEGATVLWNERLNVLRAVGDVQGLLSHLRSPVEPVADNGNCGNCACGMESLGAASVNPAGKK